MLSQIIINLFVGFIALSLTSGVALHDSRIDKAFVSAVASPADTSAHDYGHALSHELHIHGSRQTVNNSSDPIMAHRSHRKHSVPHVVRAKTAA